MKKLRYSTVSTFIFTLLSVFNAIILINTDHLNIFNSVSTDSILYSINLRGYIRYIGYLIMIIAFILEIIVLTKKKMYDEFELERTINISIMVDIFNVFLLPTMVCLILFNREYYLEIAIIFMLVQWLINVVKNIYFRVVNK